MQRCYCKSAILFATRLYGKSKALKVHTRMESTFISNAVMYKKSNTKYFYLVAGEPSGDVIGSKLMKALRSKLSKSNVDVEFAGVGGRHMQLEGLKNAFPMEELSVMGFFKPLLHYFTLKRRMNQLIKDIQYIQPHAVITIDSKGFNFRLLERLKREKITTSPLIHYVGPTSIWAFERRRNAPPQFIDHMLLLLPFEPQFYPPSRATYVGHHSLEDAPNRSFRRGDAASFKQRRHIASAATVITLLPGSRTQELEALLPLLQQVVANLAKQLPAVHVLLPTVDSLYDSIVRAVAHWNIPCDVFTESAEDKYAAFAASDIAIACSGTVTIELCVARLPMVVVYPKLSVLTQLLLRYLKPRVTSLALPNILLNHSIIPECTFNSCTADNISATALAVLSNPFLQSAQLQAMDTVIEMLSIPTHNNSASHCAADVILNMLNKQQ